MWNLRTAGTALLTVFTLCCAVGSRANPLPIPDHSDELHAAAEVVVDFGYVGTEVDTFISTLCRDRHARLDEETLDLMEAHLELFVPLLAETQVPGCGLRPEIHEWLRPLADAEAKETMCSALRLWLTDSWLVFPHRGQVDAASEDDEQRLTRRAEERRLVQAAELLSDWRDTTAVPLIEAVRNSMVDSAGGWGALDEDENRLCWLLGQSLLRIHDPLASAILVHNEAGQLGVRRGSDEITAALRFDSPADRRPDMDVSLAVASRVLKLLPNNAVTELSRRPRWFFRSEFGGALVISFSDGAEVTLRVTWNGRIICTDNRRQSNPRYEFDDPELRELLLDITSAFRDGFSAYPPFSLLSQDDVTAESAAGS